MGWANTSARIVEKLAKMFLRSAPATAKCCADFRVAEVWYFMIDDMRLSKFAKVALNSPGTSLADRQRIVENAYAYPLGHEHWDH